MSKIEEVDWAEEMDWDKTSPESRSGDNASPQGVTTTATCTLPSSRSVGIFGGSSRTRKRGELAAQIGMRDHFPDGYNPDRTISAVSQRLNNMRPGTCNTSSSSATSTIPSSSSA